MIDYRLLTMDCRHKIEEKHMTELGDRVQPLGSGNFFLPGFIRFQYGELSPQCPPHKTIIKLVDLHKLIRVGLDYCYPNDRDITRDTIPTRQDKNGKVQDLNLNLNLRKGECERGTLLADTLIKDLCFPDEFLATEFQETFLAWMAVRMDKDKPVRGWKPFFQKQIDFLKPFGIDGAKSSLECSTINDYTGLFPPKTNYGHAANKTTSQRSVPNIDHSKGF